MKVYVEEKDMPKDCASCKYYVLNCSDSYSCIKQNGKAIHPNFSDGMGHRHEDCPFHSIADYTKQVRKEVCEIIWGGFVGLNNINGNYEYKKFEDDFRKFLDQIEQGETK